MKLFRRFTIALLLAALIAVSVPSYAENGNSEAPLSSPDPENSAEDHESSQNHNAYGRYDRFSFSSFNSIVSSVLPVLKTGEDKEAAYNIADYVDEETLAALTSALSGRVIGIDPGHQETADEALEPYAPGSDRLKLRQSCGSHGVRSNAQESVVNLLVSSIFRDMLESCGATVIMTRESNDVSISNAERAELMNASSVELWIRLHCDSSRDQSVRGASILVPYGDYCDDIATKSELLGACVLNSFIESTGVTHTVLIPLDDQTGFNYSESPVIAVEMGYLSNPLDDIRLNRESYQTRISLGLVNGVSGYFELLPSLDQGENEYDAAAEPDESFTDTADIATDGAEHE